MSSAIVITQELSKESVELIRKIIADAFKVYNVHQNNVDELLQINKAAELLGVTTDTIRVYVRSGQIKSYKKGKCLYFSKQELIEWVKSEPKKPKIRYRAD